ncbi:MAG: hypothetical protein JWR10_4088, partial [Rubritepida sp.]|nr:hypothetical protein [Rubritepida sp.]
MGRRIRTILLGVLLAALPLAAVAGWFLLPRVELGPFVATRASARLGRVVAIDSLRVTPGRRVSVALRGARLDNIEGGTRRAMLQLETLAAEIELWPLLRGVVVVRQVEVHGMSLLLEHASGGRRNWRFRDPAAPAAPSEPQRDLPVIYDLRLTGSEIVVRTSGGKALRAGMESATLTTPAPDRPVILEIGGSYNGVPLTLAGTLGSFDQLHDAAAPFPLDLRATADDTVLTLTSTASDPLNFEGVNGRLTLVAPTPDKLMAIAEADGAPAVPLNIAGTLDRRGDLWRLTGIEGTLDSAGFTGALLQLTEGKPGEPDAVAAELDFSRLNLNRLLSSSGGDDSDMPLAVEAAPDPRIEARLTAEHLSYGRLRASEARLNAAVGPGRINVETLAMRAFGARISATGRLEAVGRGTRVGAELTVLEGNLTTLRQALGIRDLPLSGLIEGRAVASGEGRTLNAATASATVAAVVTMTGGTISREVIEMASTDIRSLFRTPRGTTPLSCLVAIVYMRGGRGELMPLRLR